MPTDRKLTERQHIFAREFVATGNASEAYRRAYPRSKAWKPLYVHQEAAKLLPKVLPRVEALRAEADGPAKVTRGELVERLTQALRCSPGSFIRADGSVDLTALRRAGPELDELSVEETQYGRKVKWKKAPLVAVSDRLARIMGWDAPQQVDVVTSTAEDRERAREAFRAMSPEERAEWLRQHKRTDPGPG